ncbi:threonine/alanine tRNA ligase second additional domain protein, partial [Teladorsagia circumcincta]
MVADDLKENVPLQKEAKVSMAPTELKPWPEFIQKRIDMWDRLMAEYKAELAQKDKQPFERLEMTKEDLLEMFKYNEFKVRIIKEKINTPKTTVYRCGPLIDLCRGPHVRHTGKIKVSFNSRHMYLTLSFCDIWYSSIFKAMQITKASSSYWEGKADAESLQRVYGISFPDPKQLKEWQKFQVITPNMYNSKLWETSGHWQHYSDDMFKFEVEKEQFGLKPMNCPGHCLMYSHQPRTHNELPIRYADFGVLH